MSYPDSRKFNPDFNALSKDLIEYLVERGVRLIGIDTPSFDPFDSKDLPAHHATISSRLALLEGIDLSEVEPGSYTLISLPLKIEKGDGSPVRAVLLRQ